MYKCVIIIQESVQSHSNIYYMVLVQKCALRFVLFLILDQDCVCHNASKLFCHMS